MFAGCRAGLGAGRAGGGQGGRIPGLFVLTILRVKVNLPTWASLPGVRVGHALPGGESIPRKPPHPGFSGIIKFPLAILGKAVQLKGVPSCQEKSFRAGGDASRATPEPQSTPARRHGTRPGQPRPLTAAPHSTASVTRHPPPRGSPRGPPFPAVPLPLTALPAGCPPPSPRSRLNLHRSPPFSPRRSPVSPHC